MLDSKLWALGLPTWNLCPPWNWLKLIENWLLGPLSQVSSPKLRGRWFACTKHAELAKTLRSRVDETIEGVYFWSISSIYLTLPTFEIVGAPSVLPCALQVYCSYVCSNVFATNAAFDIVDSVVFYDDYLEKDITMIFLWWLCMFIWAWLREDLVFDGI